MISSRCCPLDHKRCSLHIWQSQELSQQGLSSGSPLLFAFSAPTCPRVTFSARSTCWKQQVFYSPDTGKACQCHFPQETRCKHLGAARNLPWWKTIFNFGRREHCTRAFPMPGWHSRIAFHLVPHALWIVAGVLCSCASWSQWHGSPCWAGITSNSHREISAPRLHLDCNTHTHIHTHSSNKVFVKQTNWLTTNLDTAQDV